MIAAEAAPAAVFGGCPRDFAGRRFALVSNLDLNLYKFRMPLFRALMERGAEVYAVAPAGDYAARLEAEGVRFAPYPLDRAGLNPFTEARSVLALAKVFRGIRPDLVHSFTLKANIYATFAARMAGVPRVFATITGLGSYFIDIPRRRPVSEAILALLRAAAPGIDTMIFQNDDDREYLLRRGVRPRRIETIRGSGVDVDRFDPARFSAGDRARLRREFGFPPDAAVAVMMARLIWDKGVREFREAARILKRKLGDRVHFALAGDFYEGNPSGVPRAYIDEAAASGDLSYHGYVEDVPAFLAACDIAVLPSYYREGVPVFLLEALSMGLPIVTCRTPGSADTVVPGQNGVLVPARSASAVADAVLHYARDSSSRMSSAPCSRGRALALFSSSAITKELLYVYAESIPASREMGS